MSWTYSRCSINNNVVHQKVYTMSVNDFSFKFDYSVMNLGCDVHIPSFSLPSLWVFHFL